MSGSKLGLHISLLPATWMTGMIGMFAAVSVAVAGTLFITLEMCCTESCTLPVALISAGCLRPTMLFVLTCCPWFIGQQCFQFQSCRSIFDASIKHRWVLLLQFFWLAESTHLSLCRCIFDFWVMVQQHWMVILHGSSHIFWWMHSYSSIRHQCTTSSELRQGWEVIRPIRVCCLRELKGMLMQLVLWQQWRLWCCAIHVAIELMTSLVVHLSFCPVVF